MKRLKHVYGCPTELAVDLVGGKWKMVILAQLKQGPMRYADLRRAIAGISDKVLTERLRQLEQLGFVEPVTSAGLASYGLSARADALHDVLEALFRFGEREGEQRRIRFALAGQAVNPHGR